MDDTISVGRISDDQIEEAADLLNVALNPPESRRQIFGREPLLRFMRYCTAHGDPLVATRKGKMIGIAVWMPPHAAERVVEQEREFGFDEFPSAFGESFPAYRAVKKILLDIRARSMQGPHWYLPFVASDPNERGAGIGGRLLRPVLLRADEGGLPCFAESFNRGASNFFQRHGFTVLTEGAELTGGISYWTYRREPQPLETGN